MTCNAHALAASRGMLHAADVDLIREVAASLPAGAAVADVGCGSGTVALALLGERRDVKVVSVDLDGDNVNRWTRAVLENTGVPITDCWEGVVGDAVEVAARFEDGSFDAAVLDVGHDYDDTVAELAAWLPKVKPGGLVVKHDYDPVEAAPEVYPGVKPAVDEAVARGELEIVERRGWSVLCRRIKQPNLIEERRVELPTPTPPGADAVPWDAAKESAKAQSHLKPLVPPEEGETQSSVELTSGVGTPMTPPEAAPAKAAPKARKPAQRRKRR